MKNFKAYMQEIKKQLNVKTLTAVSVFFLGLAIGHTGSGYIFEALDQESVSQAEFAQVGLPIQIELPKSELKLKDKK